MGIFLNPGNAGFAAAVRSSIYVDKTGLLDYTNQVLGTKQRFMCVSRPRRFGKSMALKMLAAYYSRGSVLAYHNELSLSCTISLAYYSARKSYTLVRELPSGKGFADIVFIPRRHVDKPAIVVELKWNRSAPGAIRQIKEKCYEGILKDYAGDVLLVGINYSKKSKRHKCIIETAKF